jgi:hypothetical protein
MTGLFGGEGFIMQKLEGDGWVFVQMGGTMVERELKAGEELHVDTGCLAAYTPSVDFDLIMAGGVKSALFGGEGLFFARLRGPGKVWIQSLPFSRLAGRMLAAAGGRRSEPRRGVYPRGDRGFDRGESVKPKTVIPGGAQRRPGPQQAQSFRRSRLGALRAWPG